jgi:hypothetical protein
MELSDYLQGGDILDFINQYLEDLDNKEREENRPKMDFKTLAKLTSMSCGLKRTSSDKAKSGVTASDHKGSFQLEFVSISQVINHMTCCKFSALIG